MIIIVILGLLGLIGLCSCIFLLLNGKKNIPYKDEKPQRQIKEKSQWPEESFRTTTDFRFGRPGHAPEKSYFSDY